MGGTSTLSDLGSQPQTAPPQAPVAPHPLADLGFKPVAQPSGTSHPLADLGFRPAAPPPAPVAGAGPQGLPGVPPAPLPAGLQSPAAAAAGVPTQAPPTVAGAGPLGLPGLPAHPAVAMQPSLAGETYAAVKEAATHPIETLTGADLPSQAEAKQSMLEQGAASGDTLAKSALDIQKTEQAPVWEPSASKTFQKMLDPKSKNVVSRVLTGGTKALEALSAPDNLELLATLPFAPEDATQLLSAVFSAQMAQGAGQEGYNAIRAAHRGDYGDAAEKGATALISAAMAAASAKHATAEKPVLHTSNDVEELRASAERQSDKIGDAASAATEGVPGAKLEKVRDSKDTDRIEDKAERQGVKPSQIADIAAAKITVPDQAAADKVLEQLHEQMPVESVNGSLDEPGKNGVRQVQAVVNTGAEGEPVKRAEVLIQTPEMNEATARTHDDYRKSQELRAAGKIEEAQALEEKITAEHEAAAKLSQSNQGERGKVVSGEKPEQAASTAEPKYKFGSTQTNIPKDSEAHQALAAARGKIDKSDLMSTDYGGDAGLENDLHVTLRYGFKGEDTVKLRRFIESQAPFEATLGKTNAFPPSEHSDGAAPIIAPVESPELHRIEAEIDKHGDFAERNFPDYKPHATLGYVKPEAAEKYKGMDDTEGKKFSINSIAITDRDGNATEIPLRGVTKPTLGDRAAIGGHKGRATEVLTPTRKMPSTYRLVEAADLVPSHNANTFEETPDYPKGVQERDYKGSKEAQNRVIQQAQNYDPAYTVNTNPDAVNGPPVITPDGTVLGGNSRAMSTQRLYAERKGNRYRETLKRDAATYGLKPEQIDGMKEPVLVREIERPASVEDARKIGSELNKSMTGALGVSERAVSAGKSLKPETLRTVADMLQQDDSSLRELLAKRGPELLKMMTADGAITERERPQFVDQASGGLSEEGKTFFERALMGSVIDDPRLMDAAPKSILAKLERSLGSLASVASRPDEWNLLPAVRRAVAEHAAIAKAGYTVDLHLNQRDMFGPDRNPVVDALVRTLDEKPNTVREKLASFAKDADQNPHGQSKMFGGGDAFDAFNHAFGSKLTDEEYHNATADILRTDPASRLTVEPRQEASAQRNEGVSERATGEPPPGRGAGNGQAPRPPAERGAERPTARTAGESDLTPRAPKPPGAVVKDAAGKEHVVPDWMTSRLPKAPKPPAAAEKPSVFKPGRQNTPVEVRDADGNWVHGTLDYYNDGVNGSPQRGRVTLANGFKMNNVPETDMRVAREENRPVNGVTAGVGEQTKPSHGAVAYDLDKTLAEYDGYKGPTEIGKPIKSEIANVKRDLAAGKDVWIFSARVADPEAVPAIKAWTKEHLGKELPVTNVKYPEFERFVDDRAEKPGYMEGGKNGARTNSGNKAVNAQQLGAGEVPGGTGAGSGDRGGSGEGQGTGKKLGESRPKPDRISETGPVRHVSVRREGNGEDATHPEIARERTENEARVADRQSQLDAAAKRNQFENAAAHKSQVIEIAGRKALVLDTDGEAVWHRFFRNIPKVNGENPLGADVSWRGMTLDKTGVSLAIARLHGALGDMDLAGIHNDAARDGLERMAKLLKDARGEQGGAVVMNGDYRADTAREEATHQWQMDHGLTHSDAVMEVARRPEFEDTIEQLRDLGYDNVSPRVLAVEAMAKAMAGDLDLPLTDEQRENLVRSFLTEAVEERGAGILANMPETDPRLKDVIREVKRGYDYGDEYNQGEPGDSGNEGGRHEALRGAGSEAEQKIREGDGGTHPHQPAGKSADEDSRRTVPEERTPPDQLKAPKPPEKQISKTGSDEPVFQRQEADREAAQRNLEAQRTKILNLQDSISRLSVDIQKRRINGNEAITRAYQKIDDLSRERDDAQKRFARMEREEQRYQAEEAKGPAAKQDSLFQRKAPKPPPSMALPGFGDAVEEQARAAQDFDEKQQKGLVESTLRTPKEDISKAAGEMERHSPLFFGSDANEQRNLFQQDPEARRQNPWFLKSDRILEQKMKGPMPGDALLRMLENNGVKADELKWSGFEDLKGKARVTPAEVRQHMAENAVKIEEVTKGEGSGKGARASELGREADDLIQKLGNSQSFAMFLHTNNEKAQARAIAEAPESERILIERYAANEREAHELANRGVTPQNDEPKYGNYTLPGGKNYREMLLTVPEARAANDSTLNKRVSELNAQLEKIGDPAESPDEYMRIVRERNSLLDAHKAAGRDAAAQNFKSGHWDEPNVLAHLRVNDRTTPDGKKLLHVEEIQSDWHQKGREQGYRDKDEPLPEKPKYKVAETEHQWAAVGTDGREITAVGKGTVNGREAAEEYIKRYLDREFADYLGRYSRRLQDMLPDAPFKKDWHEMAFRRAVKYAADNGYDGVSWTPGEKQAERYSLEKQIEELRVFRRDDGSSFDLSSKVKNGGLHDIASRIEPNKLWSYVGKEMAQRILEDAAKPDETPAGTFEPAKRQGTWKTYSGLDLKVGGEGMKGFYDKIIPDYARKFGKQWGAKVDETTIPLGKQEKGKYAGSDMVSRAEVNRIANNSDNPAAVQRAARDVSDAMNAGDPFVDAMEQYGSPALAELLDGHMSFEKRDQTQNVPYLEITPEMRKDVVEHGVPLFQKAKDGDNAVARSVSELVDDLKAMPKADKGTALDRVASWTKDAVEDSLTRSGKALGGIPSAFEKAFAWAKATTAALVHDYLKPIEQTDWKTQAGQMQLAQTETALKLQDLAKELKAQAPKALDRVAMTHYMEAAGSEAKLKEWQAGAKARAMEAIGSERAKYLREVQQHYDQALKLTPEQKELVKRLRQHFDDMLDIAKKNGLLEYGYRNYVMHLYEKAEAANILHLVDTSELNPDPSFIKRRFHDTFYTAEGAGLTPKSKDIGYLLTAYDKSMNEAIASRNFMRSLLDAKAPDGRPIAAIKIRGGWVIAKGDQEPQVLRQRQRPATLEGYRDFDRPQLRNFLFKPTTEDLEGFDPKLFEEDPEKLAFRGDLIIHPKYASRVEDMLTPSWFERGEGPAQKIGNFIVKGSAGAKELMTIAAPFHIATEGVHALGHKVNPFRNYKIDLTDPTQTLLASHGLALTNYDAEGLFATKALKGLAEPVPGLNTAMDFVHSFGQWQFEQYIPGLKMEVAKEAYARNRERYPKLSDEQVAELTAKQSNAAFGNLNTTFDAIPRTKTFKTLARLALFAPDFLESRMRFVGQAFTRYGGEQRAALIRSALTMYVAARVGNALANQGDAKWDSEDAFSLVINGRRYGLRSVQGDALHAILDPRGFIYNRLNPLTTRPLTEFLSGRDQFGRQKSATSQVKDIAKSTAPFGLQKVIQTSDEGWLDSLLTSFGIMSSNYRSPTEEEVHKLYLSHIPDTPEYPEKQAETRKMRGYEDKVRSGHMTPTEVWAKVEKKEITPQEAGRTIQRAQKSRLQIEFSHLQLKDAIDVYAKATPLEQAELKPEFARKQAAIADLPESQREKTAETMQKLLALNNH